MQKQDKHNEKLTHNKQKEQIEIIEQEAIEQEAIEQEAIEHNIKLELERFEGWFPLHTPDLTSFVRLVEEQKTAGRRRLFRDLSLFGAVAITAVTTSLIGLAQLPGIYAASQAAVFVGFTVWVAVFNRKRAGSI